ncbi:MAG TPA: hypothetical protein VKH41_12805 [Myxococcota bacterium]|nr:hypothetical protein [Myxococcota bacterium]
MAESLRVVVRYADGRTLKGTTQDFRPASPRFHLIPADGAPVVDVRVAELKAVFFVRNFAGSSERTKLRGFLAAPPETSQGKKVAVLFRDGELLCGYTLTFSPDRAGFFMFTADAASNNLRIYVVTAAAAEVKAGPAAEDLAQRALKKR